MSEVDEIVELVDEEIDVDPKLLVKLARKDLKAAVLKLSKSDIRFLVDYYYTMQEHRISVGNQVRSLGDEPNVLLSHLFGETQNVEKTIKSALDIYTDHEPVGNWLKSIYGIGPVISAGFLCHIDITKAPTLGHILSFAGWEPDIKWEKGQKRPWNAKLKALCWKAGESFVKLSKKEECFYGRLLVKRKMQEVNNNEAGLYKEQALARVGTVGKTTDAYKYYSEGKLPPAHIHARARRYAVKILLSHLHTIMYWNEYKTAPPVPYAMAHRGHVDYIPPVNMYLFPGLEEALKESIPAGWVDLKKLVE